MGKMGRETCLLRSKPSDGEAAVVVVLGHHIDPAGTLRFDHSRTIIAGGSIARRFPAQPLEKGTGEHGEHAELEDGWVGAEVLSSRIRRERRRHCERACGQCARAEQCGAHRERSSRRECGVAVEGCGWLGEAWRGEMRRSAPGALLRGQLRRRQMQRAHGHRQQEAHENGRRHAGGGFFFRHHEVILPQFAVSSPRRALTQGAMACSSLGGQAVVSRLLLLLAISSPTPASADQMPSNAKYDSSPSAASLQGSRIGIIGGGVAASAFVYNLRKEAQRGDVTLTLFEMGRTVGGRASTRFTRSRPDLHLDTGAPEFSAETKPFQELCEILASHHVLEPIEDPDYFGTLHLDGQASLSLDTLAAPLSFRRLMPRPISPAPTHATRAPHFLRHTPRRFVHPRQFARAPPREVKSYVGGSHGEGVYGMRRLSESLLRGGALIHPHPPYSPAYPSPYPPPYPPPYPTLPLSGVLTDPPLAALKLGTLIVKLEPLQADGEGGGRWRLTDDQVRHIKSPLKIEFRRANTFCVQVCSLPYLSHTALSPL